MLKLAVILTALLTLTGSSSGADYVETLSSYLNVHRAQLLKDGWQPVPQANHAAAETLAPNSPEVVCGNAACVGFWRNPAGKIVTVSIVFD